MKCACERSCRSVGRGKGLASDRQAPTWPEVLAKERELKVYWSQVNSLVTRDRLVYQRWRAPDQYSNLLWLLVPQQLCEQVLGLVHGSVGVDRFGISKTLQHLRRRFY